jgi:hypothetical protein
MEINSDSRDVIDELRLSLEDYWIFESEQPYIMCATPKFKRELHTAIALLAYELTGISFILIDDRPKIPEFPDRMMEAVLSRRPGRTYIPDIKLYTPYFEEKFQHDYPMLRQYFKGPIRRQLPFKVGATRIRRNNKRNS